MKIVNQTFFFLFVLTCCLTTSCQKVEDVAGCSFTESLEGYNLVWSDEFEGTEIDASKWSYDLGDGCDVEDIPCYFHHDQYNTPIHYSPIRINI